MLRLKASQSTRMRVSEVERELRSQLAVGPREDGSGCRPTQEHKDERYLDVGLRKSTKMKGSLSDFGLFYRRSVAFKRVRNVLYACHFDNTK